MSASSVDLRAVRARRLSALRARLANAGVDGLLLSHGADLPWLTGYRAMPLERLTMLVVLPEADPVLVVPELEAPRVAAEDAQVTLAPWSEGADPVELVVDLLRRGPWPPRRLAVSDRAWAVDLLRLQARLPEVQWLAGSTVTGPLRAVKDEAEVEALAGAAAAADAVARAIQAGEVPLRGRSEAAVAEEVGRRLREAGHQAANFAIVASGPNAASPHHEPGGRVLETGDTVVLDFGGTWARPGDVGYCSDITRTVVLGRASAEVREAYAVLEAAQAAARAAVRPGVTAGVVDRAARGVIEDAGYGRWFIHRTGHGIGVEEHEEPYITAGSEVVLEPGHVFSVEPGIYLPGRFGMRLEDIVAVRPEGRADLNQAPRGLVELDG
jgi:Xaa-Pro aminopeptidase